MWFPDRPAAHLSTGQALALGALHGPAELLPISSSGHVEIVPWLCGWRYAALDPDLRKSFEVALHAGTAAALLITLRAELRESLHGLDSRLLAVFALACIPPAIAGYAFERAIERHLGSPSTIAAGLLAGALAMASADLAAQIRRYEEAAPVDGAWLGLAQACALIPGVSRNGATLAVARARRFQRRDASRLSRHVGLPVIAGAAVLKGLRLRAGGLPATARTAFAVGAIAAFASTLACGSLIRHAERGRSLWPYAIYRAALAGIVTAKLRAAR